MQPTCTSCIVIIQNGPWPHMRLGQQLVSNISCLDLACFTIVQAVSRYVKFRFKWASVVTTLTSPLFILIKIMPWLYKPFQLRLTFFTFNREALLVNFMGVYTPQVHIAQKVRTIIPQKTKIKFGKHPVIFSPSFDKAVWVGQDLSKPKKFQRLPLFQLIV